MDIVYLLGKEPLFCVDFLTDCKEVFLVMRDTWQCLALPLNLFCNISYLCKYFWSGVSFINHYIYIYIGLITGYYPKCDYFSLKQVQHTS